MSGVLEVLLLLLPLYLAVAVAAGLVVTSTRAGRQWPLGKVVVASLAGGLLILIALFGGIFLAFAPPAVFWPIVTVLGVLCGWLVRRSYLRQMSRYARIPTGAPVVRFDGRTPCPICHPVDGKPVIHGRHHTPCGQP